MKELKGDILYVEQGIICQQVNCLGIMGAGLALQVKEKFPKVFEQYREVCLKHLKFSSEKYTALGNIQVCTVNGNLMIVNVFAQAKIGAGRRTSYDALDSAFGQLQIFTWENDLPVYFPKYMGCDLGGGRWDIYSAIIKSYFPTAFIVDFENGNQKGKVPYDSSEYEDFKGMSIINYES